MSKNQINVSGVNETFAKILAEETRLISEDDATRGDEENFALVCYQVLNEASWIKLEPDNFFFSLFLTQVRKHAGLSILSVARQHHVQALLDLRQTIEAATWMLFAMEHKEPTAFFMVDERGAATVTDAHKNRMRKWLDDGWSAGSSSLKTMKKAINGTCAHADVTYALNNFNTENFSFTFFDQMDGPMKRSDFFFIGTCLWQIMDLAYGINQKHKAIEFSAEFVPTMKSLKAHMERLRTENVAENQALKVLGGK